MSWHIHSSASFCDSDAYGTDTDSPASASELLNDSLKASDERAITEAISNFIEELASEYFYTSNWDDEWWSAWRDKFIELT